MKRNSNDISEPLIEPDRNFPSIFNTDAPTVLIAEDDNIAREILGTAFKKRKYKVESARDGEECLQKMHDRVSVIVLDLLMPGLNGFECLKELRIKHPSIPVVVLSAFGVPEAVRALKMGAYSYVQKPILPSEVVALVTDALKNGQNRPEQINAEGYTQHENHLTIPIGLSMSEAEQLIINKTLEACRGNKAAAARILKISDKSIYNKTKEGKVRKGVLS